MNATVLDDAVVETNAMVAAGAVVKPGFLVPSYKLAAGVPAKVVRSLTDSEVIEFINAANRYVEYTKITIDSLKKNNFQTDW
jgi:carbonic anhydrase/acetyltransferase-like protein (isoleucine patch superfamily)